LIVQGRDDVNVPAERTERDERRASDPALDVRYFDGTDHFDVIDPTHESWKWTLRAIAAAIDRV
jgi:hypothetical protein